MLSSPNAIRELLYERRESRSVIDSPMREAGDYIIDHHSLCLFFNSQLPQWPRLGSE